MSVSYTCPNPSCGVTLKTPNRVAPGKKVTCPKCREPFVAEPEETAKKADAGTLKLMDEPKPPPPPPSRFHDPDDDEDPEATKKGYGVVKETEAEEREAAKNKPKFTEVQDKFKKSARGPAMGLLVMPANLLTAEGLLTGIAGLVMFVVGMWPIVFNDAPMGDEEMEEAVFTMVLGTLVLFWGAGICFGASQMQELGSFTWAVAGAVLGILPLLIGIYGLVMLFNPKVKIGFEESEGGPDDDDDDLKKDDDDDDEDADDDDEDDEGDDEKAKKKKSKKRKRDDDEDDDD